MQTIEAEHGRAAHELECIEVVRGEMHSPVVRRGSDLGFHGLSKPGPS